MMKRVLPLLFALLTFAAGSERSPYFEIRGEKNVDSFPLKSSHSAVTITGPMARVELTQTYLNEGEATIDATYLFPSSTGAAVHGMTMKIGERTIVAEIQEKAKARETFEQAKRENKSASLLTQKRPNVFAMEVAQILPGDMLTLTLSYSEIITPNSGTYEFLIPSALGPRFQEGAATSASVTNPFLGEGQKTLTRFSVDLVMNSPLAIQNLACPSHEQAKITFISKTDAQLKLAPTHPDRDFIIRYQLAGQKIQAGLLTHDGDEKAFLLQLEPPSQATPSDIPGRDFIFVIDVSGSMRGFPLNLAKDLFKDLARNLTPDDSFNMLLFAGSNKILSATSLPATEANTARAINFLDSTDGNGGTRLLGALDEALAIPHDRDRSRSLVLISDGFISAEAEVFDLIRDKANGTNIFPLGVGSSVNRHLLEGLSHFAGRDHFIVTHSTECDEAVKRFRSIVATPVLTNIQIKGEGVTLTDLLPARQPDLFAGQPLSLVGKWQGEGGSVTVTGTTGGGEKISQTFEIIKGTKNATLPTLWARAKVKELGDFASLTNRDSERKEVTRLGLKYQLLTPFTSFVAVSQEVRVRKKEAVAVAVTQGKPLPQGVASSAKGNSSGSVPEPSSSLLLLLVGALTVTLRIRN
ncbi:MAG: Ca-activated chloride channel family protein [Akkermansiaceae bacterium]|jgi:Ca-activated chloride channel family protein